MKRNIHLSLNVRGAIHNRDYAWIVRDDGSPASPSEALDFLLDNLEKGVRVLPVGECPNFDPVKGCPGHEVIEP